MAPFTFIHTVAKCTLITPSAFNELHERAHVGFAPVAPHWSALAVIDQVQGGLEGGRQWNELGAQGPRVLSKSSTGTHWETLTDHLPGQWWFFPGLYWIQGLWHSALHSDNDSFKSMYHLQTCITCKHLLAPAYWCQYVYAWLPICVWKENL